jgi:hypothetical protein
MPTQIALYSPYALTILIFLLFLTLFLPPLLGYVRAVRRTAARTRPQYLNLCGPEARHNMRRMHHQAGDLTGTVPMRPPHAVVSHERTAMPDPPEGDPLELDEYEHAYWDNLSDDPIDDEHTLVVGCFFPATCLAGYHTHYTSECYTAEEADAYDEAMENKERETVSDPRAA